jgi:proteic killer suppression protein
MQLHFKTQQLQKEFQTSRLLDKNRGKLARKIRVRLAELDYANNLEELRNAPGRYHELGEDKKGWLSCSLDGSYRLIFEPYPPPPPTSEQGELIWAAVRSVRILGVLDYHERKNRTPK